MSHVRQLRWFQRFWLRLSFWYTLIIVAPVVIALAITFSRSFYNYHSINQLSVVADEATEGATQLSAYLAAKPTNAAALDVWLANENKALKFFGNVPRTDRRFGLSYYSRPSILTVVTDAQGMIIASAPQDAATIGAALATQLPQSQAEMVRAALRRRSAAATAGATRTEVEEPNGALAAAAPIFNDDGNRVGAFFIRIYAPYDWRVYLSNFIEDVGGILGIMILTAGIVGVGFASMRARRITARLKVISAAADAWGRGDFAATAADHSADEIGLLVRRLNAMARDLQGVLVLRQELATLEERNRLARDLHDTVKQQVFALAMQIGAAQQMLTDETYAERDVRKRLADAEKLSRQVQDELVTILKELQPASQVCENFAVVLRDYVADWSQQSNIKGEVKSEQFLMLPPAIKEALFRITQESLANVLRHSGATYVLVEAKREKASDRHNGGGDHVTLAITDNGVGADVLNNHTGGMGLRNMRERAEGLPGGWFAIESGQGRGLRVTAGCRIDAMN